MIEAMQTGLFSFVAHPDLAMAGWKTWEDEAKSCFGAIIDCAIENKLPLEVNGQGMQKPMMKTENGIRYQYPFDEFWLLAKEKGARIIANSDAHQPLDVIQSAIKAREFAKNLGIELSDITNLLLGQE
jgi:histidinol-phosphatase (PHP family)